MSGGKRTGSGHFGGAGGEVSRSVLRRRLTRSVVAIAVDRRISLYGYHIVTRFRDFTQQP